MSHYTRRISGLERRSTDLDAELIRAKADLSATRDSVIMHRNNKNRKTDDWLNSLNASSLTGDSDDESKDYSARNKTIIDEDLLHENSLSQNKLKTR